MNENNENKLINSKSFSLKPSLYWLPQDVLTEYEATDLTFDIYLILIAQLELSKQEKYEKPTIRQWYIEILRKGWRLRRVRDKVALLKEAIVYGKLGFQNWVAADTNTQDLFQAPPKPTDDERTNEMKHWKGMFSEIIAKIDSGELRTKNTWVKDYKPEPRATKRDTGLPATYKADCVKKWREAEKIKKYNRTK